MCFSKFGIPFHHQHGCTISGGDLLTSTHTIAASPYTKQPATMNYRVVLRWSVLKKEFVVHDQMECDGKTWFEHGTYFPGGEKELPNALRCFAKRVEQQAEHAKSCFRNVA